MPLLRFTRSSPVHPLTLLAVGVVGLLPTVPYALAVAWCYLRLVELLGVTLAAAVTGVGVFATLPVVLVVLIALELLLIERLPWSSERDR
ncbi:hypothetical protein C474_17344 [Halogeometricum pallidum JCM 14848]|uniref:Uncharacterized protein n=1 Tax=Halogeometricum pallidum JCM 14848 TaxID=1227487 RepID=M0CV86_HALPD|nr:hypothetical protein [Halogeometricum pallidum]ELZ27135.1 hypothetical protein C474_17344 [Halogeometricum pallidum JCM 14848]